MEYKLKNYVKRRSSHLKFAVNCMDDFEKAKGWLL